MSIEADVQRQALQRDVEALADAARAAQATELGLDTPIPACDGWTMSRLLGHAGRIQRWALESIRAEPGTDLGKPEGPGDAERIGWLLDLNRQLLDELAACDLDGPADTWAGQHTNRWWLRRVVNETTVHRWDAQDAVGDGAPIPEAVAVDGIDEFLDTFVPNLVDPSGFAGPAASLHLHATDVAGEAGEWSITFGDDGVEWSHAHEKGDAAVRGPASDLYLLVWGRVGIDVLDVFGDPVVVTRWRSATTV
jgi:uncharacterized protein (TIGR03083 family)